MPNTKRVGNGRYIYRGITLQRNDRLRSGIWGHWRTMTKVGLSQYELRAGTMRRLMRDIDTELEAQKERGAPLTVLSVDGVAA